MPEIKLPQSFLEELEYHAKKLEMGVFGDLRRVLTRRITELSKSVS